MALSHSGTGRIGSRYKKEAEVPPLPPVYRDVLGVAVSPECPDGQQKPPWLQCVWSFVLYTHIYFLTKVWRDVLLPLKIVVVTIGLSVLPTVFLFSLQIALPLQRYQLSYLDLHNKTIMMYGGLSEINLTIMAVENTMGLPSFPAAG